MVLSVNSGLLDSRKSWLATGECDFTCKYLDKEEEVEEKQVETWLLQRFQLSGVCVLGV